MNYYLSNRMWRREGYCCNCGECCGIHMPHMMGLNRRCKYIYLREDDTFCEIRAAVEAEDSEFLEMIPEKDFKYWKDECQPYPNPEKRAHTPPRHKLPGDCTYQMIWLE